MTLQLPQSVFRGFGTGVTRPAPARSRERRSLQRVSLRVPLRWCVQEAQGGPQGQGISPSVAVAVPASCLVAPGRSGGDGLPRPLRAGRAAEPLPRESRGTQAAAGGTESRVPAPRCTLPSRGASLEAPACIPRSGRLREDFQEPGNRATLETLSWVGLEQRQTEFILRTMISSTICVHFQSLLKYP